MATTSHTAAGKTNHFEKQQMRDQISCHVEEFLNRGGEIRVLHGSNSYEGAKHASASNGQEDYQQLID